MSKYKLRHIIFFLKVLIPGMVGATLILGLAFGEVRSPVAWKQTGRETLLNIPAPADTRITSRSMNERILFKPEKSTSHLKKNKF